MLTARFAFAALPILATSALIAFEGPPAPVGKGVIERNPKAVVAQSSPAKTEENPTVEPGKVKWHANLEAAIEASKKSGKPVFLFQMLGRLDKQFC
ncbi:MAG: hypothetical protein U0798_07160 [Gemmataceae bacterium]